MNQVPKPTAIYAAELRIWEAKQGARNSLQRARIAFRAKLVKPATLILIAGTTGVTAYGLIRNTRQRPAAVAQAATPTLAGVVLAFLVRYAAGYLPSVLEQGRQALMRRNNPLAGRPPAQGFSQRP